MDWIEGARVNQQGIFTRNHWMKPSSTSIRSFRRIGGNTGLFLTAYRYSFPMRKRSPGTPHLLGDMYFDLDAEGFWEHTREDALLLLDYLKTVFTIPHDQIRIFFSGQKGLHLIIPHQIFSLTPDQLLHRRFRKLAMAVTPWLQYQTLDTGVYDARRVLRLTNSRHQESGLYKIPLTYAELESATMDEILGLAAKPRKLQSATALPNAAAHRAFYQLCTIDEEKPGKPKDSIDFMPPCIEFMFQATTVKPGRNNILTILASYCIRRGMKEEEALDTLLTWNSEKVSPPLAREEVLATYKKLALHGGYNYGCQTLEMFHCDMDNCKIGKARQRKERPLVRR